MALGQTPAETIECWGRVLERAPESHLALSTGLGNGYRDRVFVHIQTNERCSRGLHGPALRESPRPYAAVRKNGHIIWLFAGSESAGRRAAAIMSQIATAKANDLDPHAWLSDVLTRLPTTLDRDIGDLLPHRWKRAG